MGSFTREILTATQKFDENDKLSEMLAEFAQELFEDGLIKISTRYDKDTGEIYKELSAKLMRERGNIICFGLYLVLLQSASYWELL